METVWSRTKRHFTKNSTRENIFAYSMLSPSIIGIFLFVTIPIIAAFVISFHKWTAISAPEFIGIKNYITLLSDSEWWRSVKNTFIYILIFVPSIYIISLLVAVFINSFLGKFQEVFRFFYFIPYTVSLVVAAIIWKYMLDPQKGLVNTILKLFKIPPQSFLGNPKQALLCIAFISIWMTMGYYMVLFLAAIKDIPRSYYEAARIDGANFFQLFRYVTLPMLGRVSTYVILMNLIASFQVFGLVKVLTNGGPAGATNVSVLYIYKNSFEYMKLGYSSALAAVLFLIIMVISIIIFTITERVGREQ